jgi:hypothetical protein
VTVDPHRQEAERAAFQEIEALDTDLVIRPHIWRIVNAALDAFDDSLGVSIMHTTARSGWAVLHPDGLPWLVVPTYRMARAQRRVYAELKSVPKRRVRIVRTEVVSV